MKNTISLIHFGFSPFSHHFFCQKKLVSSGASNAEEVVGIYESSTSERCAPWLDRWLDPTHTADSMMINPIHPSIHFLVYLITYMDDCFFKHFYYLLYEKRTIPETKSLPLKNLRVGR